MAGQTPAHSDGLSVGPGMVLAAKKNNNNRRRVIRPKIIHIEASTAEPETLTKRTNERMATMGVPNDRDNDVMKQQMQARLQAMMQNRSAEDDYAAKAVNPILRLPADQRKAVATAKLPEAIKLGYEGSVKALLEAGANPFVRNAAGQNAFEQARQAGRPGVEALLHRAVPPSGGQK